MKGCERLLVTAISRRKRVTAFWRLAGDDQSFSLKSCATCTYTEACDTQFCPATDENCVSDDCTDHCHFYVQCRDENWSFVAGPYQDQQSALDKCAEHNANTGDSAHVSNQVY